MKSDLFSREDVVIPARYPNGTALYTRAQFKFPVASCAFYHRLLVGIKPSACEEALFPLLIAMGTYAMRWLSTCRRHLKFVSESSPSIVTQFIARLLYFPVFKAGEICFQFLYLVNRRRIARLGGEDLFPQIRNGLIPFDRVIHTLNRLRDIEHGLKGTQTSNRFRNYHVQPSCKNEPYNLR